MGATKGETSVKNVELEPDAWERFEKAVDVVVKAPPKHANAKGEVNAKNPGKSSA